MCFKWQSFDDVKEGDIGYIHLPPDHENQDWVGRVGTFIKRDPRHEYRWNMLHENDAWSGNVVARTGPCVVLKEVVDEV